MIPCIACVVLVASMLAWLFLQLPSAPFDSTPLWSEVSFNPQIDVGHDGRQVTIKSGGVALLDIGVHDPQHQFSAKVETGGGLFLGADAGEGHLSFYAVRVWRKSNGSLVAGVAKHDYRQDSNGIPHHLTRSIITRQVQGNTEDQRIQVIVNGSAVTVAINDSDHLEWQSEFPLEGLYGLINYRGTSTFKRIQL